MALPDLEERSPGTPACRESMRDAKLRPTSCLFPLYGPVGVVRYPVSEQLVFHFSFNTDGT